MLNAKFVPIDIWPGVPAAAHKQRRSLFSSSYSKTLELLDGEMTKIRAKDILIQTYMTRDQIRNDGWPRAGINKPKSPGVILTFRREGKTVSMPCDRFDRWEDNLRAIALSLAVLRSVDRYGVTQSGEQYRGWESLPAPDKNTPSRSDAAEIIARWSGIKAYLIIADGSTCRDAVNEAMRRTHPDKGGSADDFRLVREAAKVLGERR